jgi:hypothetical protein
MADTTLDPNEHSTPQTVKERIEEMRQDLIALAHCCNRDHQYHEATKIQAMLVSMQDLDIQCADVAAWPPKVDTNNDGDSCWACVDG